MTLPTEVIAFAIRKHKDDPEAAAVLIAKLEMVRQAVANRDVRIAAIRRNAERDISSLKKEQLCSHEVQRSSCDPSGGTDRNTECLICGESVGSFSCRFT